MTTLHSRRAKSILTPQRGGFLASGALPFTHSFSPYTGCQFGTTACGQYCYAQFMPNWAVHAAGAPWGSEVWIKENAPEVLLDTLTALSPEKRRGLRIFMATTTDPYQPVEAKAEITRRCLEVFSRFDDLDLLLIQTRSPLVARDFALIASIPYAWLSITLETDDQSVVSRLGGGPTVSVRLKMIESAAALGIPTQVTVSPCLPHSENFAARLAATGARRIVVDSFVEGDGSGGRRTANSPFARSAGYDWRDPSPAQSLFEQLRALHPDVSWSAEGFSGIPPR
ncbi:MAG: radical SAM protein [Chloroflexi bacterium]|nr:radical SAM protein [Chloroflexota bacterium]